jgi:nitroreductase
MQYHRIIEEQLGIPATEMVVCGMSLGYADPSKVENKLRTEREPVRAFTTFQG